MGCILWYLEKLKLVGKLFQTIVVKSNEALAVYLIFIKFNRGFP
jgi:hypothetical protein